MAPITGTLKLKYFINLVAGIMTVIIAQLFFKQEVKQSMQVMNLARFVNHNQIT